MASDLPPTSVSADMDRIFKPLSDRAPVNSAQQDRSRQDARARGKRDWRFFTIVAPALVLVAGTALAVGYGQFGQLPKPLEATRHVAPIPPSQRAAPTATVPTPSGEQAAHQTVATDVEDPLPPPPTDGTLAPPAEASTASNRARVVDRRAVRGEQPAGTAPRATLARADSSQRPVLTRGESSDGGASSQCPPGSLEDRCIYQDVLNADARLRRAYRRARQSGVPYGQLESINRQWIRAREAAQDDPDGTIQRYDRLTGMLDRARQDGGE
ncbi:hypothetical protein [Sphingomonas sp. PAMC 26617]|uniref:hypothetical protein n=1 Tax=Sphingomonas sp. PAMC 26617 TaxID=1112216 RepID=UPI0002890150|nr:hypothetical protein [Sphingomonas sp. PAMC 26617]